MVIVDAIETEKVKRKAVEDIKNTMEGDELDEFLTNEGEGVPVQEDTIFTRPSGRKRKGFYMDGWLKSNLDDYLIPAVARKWDAVGLITGIEGCQPAGSKVLMADGEWKNIEDIRFGDTIISPQQDGSILFATVKNTTSWFSQKNYGVYQMNRKKKLLYSCSSNHKIPINVRNKKGEWQIKNFESEDYSKRAKSTRQNETTYSSFKINKFKWRYNCKIDAYSLGVYLGDGSFCKSSLNVTTPNVEVISKVYPYKHVYNKKNTTCKQYAYSSIGTFAKLLKEYGLKDKRSGDKFIPKEALLSDSKYRLNLLAGLIDTDGTLSKESSYSITTKSKQMANDIVNLVYSLGGRANMRKIKKGIKAYNFVGEYYCVSFYLCNQKIPTKVKRKTNKSSHFYLSANRQSIELKETNPGQVYGFEVDSPSHWYITDNWMVTHNSGKSTTAMSIAKYVDPTFPGELINEKTTRRTCDRIVFTPQQFMEAIDKAKVGQAIVFDEAIMGFMSTDATTDIQKALIKKMVTIRKKRLYIFIVLPSIFLLRMYMAVFRTRFLLHFYTPDGLQRGFFKFYSYDKKRELFVKGKKEFNQNAVQPDFKGRSTDTNGFFYNEKDYDMKKEEAIINITEKPQQEKEQKKAKESEARKRIRLQRDVLLMKLYKEEKERNINVTWKDFAAGLESYFGRLYKTTPGYVKGMYEEALDYYEEEKKIKEWEERKKLEKGDVKPTNSILTS